MFIIYIIYIYTHKINPKAIQFPISHKLIGHYLSHLYSSFPPDPKTGPQFPRPHLQYQNHSTRRPCGFQESHLSRWFFFCEVPSCVACKTTRSAPVFIGKPMGWQSPSNIFNQSTKIGININVLTQYQPITLPRLSLHVIYIATFSTQVPATCRSLSRRSRCPIKRPRRRSRRRAWECSRNLHDEAVTHLREIVSFTILFSIVWRQYIKAWYNLINRTIYIIYVYIYILCPSYGTQGKKGFADLVKHPLTPFSKTPSWKVWKPCFQ